MWNLILKLNQYVTTFTAMLAVLMLFLACLVVTEMVYIRYFIGGSTIWETEFVVFSIVASTLLGSPYVLLTNGHVNVDLLPNALGENKWILEIISTLISLTFVLILFYSSWEYFIETYVEDWHSESAWAPPLWIPLLSLVIGVTGLSIQLLLNVFSLIRFKKCIYIDYKEGE
ncbi:TRAP transporter small permease [Arcobacter sp. KX21116]|uniref:TRAP transporter small permease subunit n=1 Tax=Arcobacter TaxID=28196 RepID=UPI0035D48576